MSLQEVGDGLWDYQGSYQFKWYLRSTFSLPWTESVLAIQSQGQEASLGELKPPWGEVGVGGIVPERARPMVPDQVWL